MDVKKVGEFIKQKRKEKKLTQKELAQKLSITDRAISKWERGICCPDISLLKDLSSILGTSVNELLSGEALQNVSGQWRSGRPRMPWLILKRRVWRIRKYML